MPSPGEVRPSTSGPGGTSRHLLARRLGPDRAAAGRPGLLDVTVAVPVVSGVPARLTGRFVELDGAVYYVLEDVAVAADTLDAERLQPGERCARLRLERQD